MSSDSPTLVDPLAHRDPPRQIAHAQQQPQQQAATHTQRAQQHSGGAAAQATATGPSLIRPIVGESPPLDSMPPPPPRMRAPHTGASSGAAAQAASATGRAQHRDASASSSIPQMQGQDRSGPAWLAQNAAALGQPRSKGQQPQQPQTTQAAASASGQPSAPISRNKHSAGGGALLAPSSLSPSPPSAPPLSLSSSAPRPIPTLKASDTRRTLHTPLKQHRNEGAAGKREAYAPASASAQIKGTAAAGAAASGAAAAARKAPTATDSAPSSASSSSAAASSSASTARVPSSSAHNAGLVPLHPIAPRTRKPARLAPFSSSSQPPGPAETANEPPQPSSSSAPRLSLSSSVKSALAVNGAAASGTAAESTASQPLSSSATAAAGHSSFTPDAHAEEQAPAKSAAASCHRRDEASVEELSENQVPNSSDDDSQDDDDDDGDAEMGDAAADGSSTHTAAASCAAEYSDFTLPDKTTGELLRRPIQRGQSHPAYAASYKAYGVWARRTGIKLPKKPAGSSASGRAEKSGKAAKQRAHAAISDDEDSDGGSSPRESDAGKAPTSRRRSKNPLECVEHRSLPDFYIDRLSAERVNRPTRKTTETAGDFRSRYKRWYKRGKAVWTQADIEQAKQQRGKHSEQKDAQIAAASSSAAASGAENRPRRSIRRALAVRVANEDDRAGSDSSSSSTAADSSDDSDGSSDSSSGSESIPPRPTLIDCGDNLAKYEVRLAEWKAAYGQRADADNEEETPERAQRLRRARAQRKASSALDSDSEPPAVASASVRLKRTHKPDFYINHYGKRIHRPVRGPGESIAEYKRKYNPWLIAGNAVWTKKELDAARGASAVAAQDAHSSNEDEDEDSDYGMDDEDDAEFDESSVPPATRGRRTLPDSYVDPLTSQVMLRPVRAVSESERAFRTRYERWRVRGSIIGAPGFPSDGTGGRSQPAASSAAAAASSAPAPSTPPRLTGSHNPFAVMSLFDQFMRFASHNAGQAAARGVQAAVPPLASQLQAPAHAAAAAAAFVHPSIPPLSSSAAEAAMRADDETDHAGASSMPALDGSHSSAAQSRHLHRVLQSASSVAGAAPSLAATHALAPATGSAAKSKRKSDSHDRLVHADGAAAGAATAGTAAAIPNSSASASKRARPSAIPTLESPQMACASDVATGDHPHAHHSPQSAASISDDGHSSVVDRLAATSSLSLILAECISDPAKHASCLSVLLDGDISLADLERDFAIHFPRVGAPPMVQWGLITAGPAAKMQAIIRQRIELKQQMDNDCIEIKREARAAGK